MRISSILAATAASLSNVASAATLTPGVLPLIVRNPYLSTWLQHAREEPWTKWPIFYTGKTVAYPNKPRRELHR